MEREGEREGEIASRYSTIILLRIAFGGGEEGER